MSTKAPLSFNGTKLDNRLSPETQARLRQASAGVSTGAVPKPGLMPPTYKERSGQKPPASRSEDTPQPKQGSQPKKGRGVQTQEADPGRRQKILLGILCLVLLPAILMMF